VLEGKLAVYLELLADALQNMVINIILCGTVGNEIVLNFQIAHTRLTAFSISPNRVTDNLSRVGAPPSAGCFPNT
jgi:hypothetical protein